MINKAKDTQSKQTRVTILFDRRIFRQKGTDLLLNGAL